MEPLKYMKVIVYYRMAVSVFLIIQIVLNEQIVIEHANPNYFSLIAWNKLSLNCTPKHKF